MASIRQQINFEHWANGQSLAAIISPCLPVPEVLSILAHAVAISNFWAARVEGVSGTFDPWPTFSPSELGAELLRVRDRWIRLTETNALNTVVCYRSSKGDVVQNTFEEVLQEVLLHSAHHRGQIAIWLRLKGFQPAITTDFIPALRKHVL